MNENDHLEVGLENDTVVVDRVKREFISFSFSGSPEGAAKLLIAACSQNSYPIPVSKKERGFTEANVESQKIGELKGEIHSLKGEVEFVKHERDDAIHARAALEEDLKAAAAEIKNLEADVANAQRIAGTARTAASGEALHNKKVVSELWSLLAVYPSQMPARVRKLLVAEKRLNAFRDENGKLPYPTTKEGREKVRTRAFHERPNRRKAKE